MSSFKLYVQNIKLYLQKRIDIRITLTKKHLNTIIWNIIPNESLLKDIYILEEKLFDITVVKKVNDHQVSILFENAKVLKKFKASILSIFSFLILWNSWSSNEMLLEFPIVTQSYIDWLKDTGKLFIDHSINLINKLSLKCIKNFNIDILKKTKDNRQKSILKTRFIKIINEEIQRYKLHFKNLLKNYNVSLNRTIDN